MKKFLLLTALCAFAPNLAAQSDGKNSVRIGWGDMPFEVIAFHASVPGTWGNTGLPANFSRPENYDYGYTGHLFAEYLHRFSRVVSVGFQADVEGIFWKEGNFDRDHRLIGAYKQVNNWDLVLMPTVRFTYFNKPWVRLYSGLGAGLMLAFDNRGGSAAAPAFNLNLIGTEVGRDHWGGTAELGLLNALTGPYHVYQLGTRIFSVAVYYKW